MFFVKTCGMCRWFHSIQDHNQGRYLGSKWNKPSKGWSKLPASLSINGVSVISFAIRDDHVHDAKAGKGLLTSVKERIRKILGDRG